MKYILFIIITLSLATKSMSQDINVKELTEKAQEYNKEFQKEFKAFIKSIENSDVVKKKQIALGFGMDMIINFDKQFLFQINMFDRVLTEKTFKKKDELIIYLKAFTN